VGKNVNQTNPPATFFGMNLGQLRQDWIFAINQAAAWPLFRWLIPSFSTRLQLPGGGSADIVEKPGGASSVAARADKSRFSGFLLPDELVLWHQMPLPMLQPEAAKSAVALQVRSLSPFNADDVVWASQSASAVNSMTETWIGITSRKLVLKHVEPMGVDATSVKDLEFWVQMPDGKGFLVVNGFGETLRRNHALKWRAVNVGLLALLVAMGLAATITPTVQLRNRALQADQDYSKLRTLTNPIMHQREVFLRQDLQVKALQGQLESKIDIVQMLPKITKLLPDDTYLSSLKVQDSKFLLNGETPNTAALMQLLGGQPGIRDVRAPTAAVKPRGSERETFSIEFTMDAPKAMAKP
jgi:general secretion pathway protein L